VKVGGIFDSSQGSRKQKPQPDRILTEARLALAVPTGGIHIQAECSAGVNHHEKPQLGILTREITAETPAEQRRADLENSLAQETSEEPWRRCGRRRFLLLRLQARCRWPDSAPPRVPRRTLRLESLSPAQPPHGPTLSRTQTCSRSARLTGATAQPVKSFSVGR